MEWCLEYVLDDNDRLRFALKDALNLLISFCVHGSDCVTGQYREGAPTENGGYKRLYGYGKNAKWYQRGESPECTCGLSEAIAKIKEAMKDD
jgi:hypothetical protein